MGFSGNFLKTEWTAFPKGKKIFAFSSISHEYYSHIMTLKVKADEEIQLNDHRSLLKGPFGH